MRIWTVHPKYLDRLGLLALWREALLAQKVLRGQTSGYTHHPQLQRFRQHRNPVGAMSVYLRGVFEESVRRGYSFDSSKIHPSNTRAKIRETRGQLIYEWTHLLAKLRRRSPKLVSQYVDVKSPIPHPLFLVVPGPVREWEKLP